jgi:digeranylgeranylglycerophospholipid reductase
MKKTNHDLSFDVVVVGAGPAGGHCARCLAKAGRNVLLVEQHEDFYKNDFSSAATPLETLNKFALPPEVVGSFWKKIVIVTTNFKNSWEGKKSLGAVLDFAKLRNFLAEEVKKFNSHTWLGCRYLKHYQENGETWVEFQKKGEGKVKIKTQVIVDATGSARAVMYANKQDKPKFLKPAGIEYLIEVPKTTYLKYNDALVFFLGQKWMPKGYSWIFPMENNRLKVGAASYRLEHRILKKTEAIRYYIELLIKDYLQISEYQIIDIHGSTIHYCSGLKDIYYRHNAIAIGDAVSTVNMLGGEGIRHAMAGAEIACSYIEKYLCGDLKSLRTYEKEMKQRFSHLWNLSEKIGMKRYLVDSDRNIDKGVRYLSYLKTEDMMDILFYYKFGKLTKGLRWYFPQKISDYLGKAYGIINNQLFN